MWRPEPPTPTANTLRKRGRDDWAPETPTSLPRRKTGQDAAGLSAERAGEILFENNVPVGTETEVSQTIAASEPHITAHYLPDERQYISIAAYWDADVIGVVCPFCMEKEIHLMPRRSIATDVDLRVPDCDPGKQFRILFAGDDHPAVKGRKGIWVEERSRWESVYVEDLCSEESEEGSEAEEGEESATEERACSEGQDHGDPMEDLEDTPDDHIIIPGEGVLPPAAGTDVDFPIALSSDGEDEESTTEELACSGDQDHSSHLEIQEDMTAHEKIISSEPILTTNGDLGSPIVLSGDEETGTGINLTPNENAQILRLAAGLYNNPPPQYLTLGHGQAAVVYRPVAVIPIPGAIQKTIGFLAPTTSSTRRVFTRSGWKGEEISDTDIAWLQGILADHKEAPWQELTVINNRDYTEKVRELSAHLGIEPRHHNYDKECPLGQVYFSHVEKQLVVVALEEHQSSGHHTSTESPPKRTIHLNRAPCVGCLDFAKAVEHLFGLRFEFSVMSRVMSEEQARAKFRNLDLWKGGDGREVGDSADETPSDGHGDQGPRRPARAKRVSAGRYDSEAEYEVMKILDKQKSLRGEAEYLVRWKTTWLTDVQLENQLNGLYAGELDVVREMTGKTGEKRYLVEWEDSWMSQKELGNSKKLIEDYEGRRRLLE